VLPAAGTSVRDDSIFAYRDFSRVQAKIDATYDAALAYLDGIESTS
jgi:NTE family protein